MQQYNILLTGSGGFIGKNLKSYLKDKYYLLCPRSFELDLRNYEQVKKYFSNHKVDFVIHCASVGGARDVEDKDTTVEDNIAMVDNILNFKPDTCRVILFGSGAMYGKNRNLHKVKEPEIGKFEPDDLYGKSKMLIAQKVNGRDDVVCLNIFACYGYGEKDTRFPSYAIDCVLKGEDIVINQNVIFDYLFVEDMQRIVEFFIENKPIGSNIINITPDKSVSLYEMGTFLRKIGEKDVNITMKNPKMNFEYTGDNKLLKANIKGIAFTDIEEGLEKLYKYKRGRK